MSSGKAPGAFPDAEAKLAQPVKQSAFDRSRAEAEAKRKRDQAETEAVYKEFVKSFDHDDDHARPNRPIAQPSRSRFTDPSVGFNTGRRHFAASAMKKSGPGTLGPAPGYDNRRSFNDFSRPSRDVGPSPGNRELHSNKLSVSAFNNASDDEEDEVQRDAAQRAEIKAVAKPQLRITNMPTGMSAAAIRALVPDLKVEAIKMDLTSGPSTSQKKCANAVLTLSRDTPGSAMDAAISSIQNRYLGTGYSLSAQRHLSSAVLRPAGASSGASSAPQPFGAKPVEQSTAPRGNNMFQGHHRGFAPPSSYAPVSAALDRGEQSNVPVAAPDDIKLLHLIHGIAERVAKDGPDVEARLMSRPDIQQDEKFSWLWNSKSPAGVYYRWRLWQLDTRYQPNPKREPHVSVFEDSPSWKVLEHVPFEYIDSIGEFISDPDYDSSEEEEDYDAGNQGNHGGDVERPFLSPLDQSKLTYLLARLPTSHTKLRKGDVARVTVFALSHADRGPGEVVDMIVGNIGKPVAFTSANPWYDPNAKPPTDGTKSEEVAASEAVDTSAATLVGLCIASDILATASTTAYRHTWRYRGLFEKSLRERQIFEFLGLMPEKQGWGRMRAENWRRSIKLILNSWEGWSVFPTKTLAFFTSTFENPPSPQNPEDQAEDESNKGKWKAAGTAAEAANTMQGNDLSMADVEGEPIQDEDISGEPIDDEDIAGIPIEDDDIPGEPVNDDDVEGEPIDEDDIDFLTTEETHASLQQVGAGRAEGGSTGRDANIPADRRFGDPDGAAQAEPKEGRGPPPRKRMRAADMFADST
ncbi:RNA polymerase II, large subunit, CTD [Purpureocillium lavendulum]|uniref:RNA polymerase II, large subunit, CTD n=1 Tax=Purpureocillium lavendulum TaxID=1247861 RepID=A0AB34FSI0_9HYPO|nr:RNA polymerase II, large subunit, CTD [Purpureocillium lavendulum]